MAVEVKVDDKAVIAKYGRLSEALRSRLRADLPTLTLTVKAAVANKLVPGALFRTTTHLLPALSSQMVENRDEIYGRVYINESKFPGVVAATLESGSVPHVITAVNAPFLVFFWERMGHWMRIKSVNHPGFPGRSYMQSTLDEMDGYITAALKRSVMETINR
jgi:hypothetical protein